jgi:outer membrane protein assembly factor BamB
MLQYANECGYGEPNSKGEVAISTRTFNRYLILLPIGALALCMGAVAYFLQLDAPDSLEHEPRLPIEQNIPTVEVKEMTNPGTLIAGKGQPSAFAGSWPQFRGPQRDGIARPGRKLAKTWPAGGPPALWNIELGPGHAGAAVHNGRVYVMDYDRTKEEDVVRCFRSTRERNLRYTYSASVKYTTVCRARFRR